MTGQLTGQRSSSGRANYPADCAGAFSTKCCPIARKVPICLNGRLLLALGAGVSEELQGPESGLESAIAGADPLPAATATTPALAGSKAQARTDGV